MSVTVVGDRGGGGNSSCYVVELFYTILFASIFLFVQIKCDRQKIQWMKAGENYLTICCDVEKLTYQRLYYDKNPKNNLEGGPKTILTEAIEINIDNQTSIIDLNRTDIAEARVLPLNSDNGFQLYQWYVVCATPKPSMYDYGEVDESCVVVRPCDCPCIRTAYKSLVVNSVHAVRADNNEDYVKTDVTETSFGPPFAAYERVEFSLWNCDKDDSCGEPTRSGHTHKTSVVEGNQTTPYKVDTTVPAVYKLVVKWILTNEPFKSDVHERLPFSESSFVLLPFVWNMTQNAISYMKTQTIPYPNSSVINQYIDELDSFTLCSWVSRATSLNNINTSTIVALLCLISTAVCLLTNSFLS